jgi:hypothetical protein
VYEGSGVYHNCRRIETFPIFDSCIFGLLKAIVVNWPSLRVVELHFLNELRA